MLQRKYSDKICVNAGIDIQEHCVRYLVLETRGQEHNICEYGEYPRKYCILKTLQEIKQYLPANIPCAIALPHQAVIIKKIEFAEKFSEREIMELLRLNSQEYFLHPFESLAIDFEFLSKEENKIRVVATKKADIHYWIEVFMSADLNLKKINVNVLAIENSLSHLGIIMQQAFIVFFMGAMQILQIIVNEGLIELVNTITSVKMTNEIVLQEIKKFLRLYECAATSSSQISTVLLSGEYIDPTLYPDLEKQNITASRLFDKADLLGRDICVDKYVLAFGLAL
jgi:Tfp pilus assembly PilM family ATPase